MLIFWTFKLSQLQSRDSVISSKDVDDDANSFRTEEWMNQPCANINWKLFSFIGWWFKSIIFIIVRATGTILWLKFDVTSDVWYCCYRGSFDHFINELQGLLMWLRFLMVSISVNLKSSSALVWSAKNIFRLLVGHKCWLSAVLLTETYRHHMSLC